ncbi:MAG TPA: hypothetical protein VJA21_05110 [Verrucomicrobiae bacterium]
MKRPSPLKPLIAEDSHRENHPLQDRLTQTVRDERCIRRAVFLTVILCMLSLAGLSYCAILLPEILYDFRNRVFQTLCGLGLGSLASLVAFLGYLLWKRAVVSRLQGKCRLGELGVATPQFNGAAPADSH